MINERFVELYDKSRAGILSELEAIEWNEWMALSAHNRELVERIYDEEYLNTTVSLLMKARQEDWQYILEKHPELKPEGAVVKQINKVRLIRRWIAVAAAMLLVAFTSYWLINTKTPKQQLVIPYKEQLQDIRPPDTTKASITLANGQVVTLDTLSDGVLAMQGKVNVIKSSDGQITYKGTAGKEGAGEVAWNTLTNPRGSKIVSINLNDGTKVWLNNESTLRYPVLFNGNQRSVELTGEAYFEVAPSYVQSGGKRAFVITANKVTVEVLGTHFNVNNYLDESAAKVTLLEGSVKVSGKEQSVVLKPGEQAIAVASPLTTDHSQLTINNSPGIEKVMAWKNNTFYFDGENLQAIMKQLSRYYNVEVEYEEKVPDKQFGGMINRNKNLSEVLNVLELSGVNFRVEGKKIIVLK
jgi:transmembrane sensor